MFSNIEKSKLDNRTYFDPSWNIDRTRRFKIVFCSDEYKEEPNKIRPERTVYKVKIKVLFDSRPLIYNQEGQELTWDMPKILAQLLNKKYPNENQLTQVGINLVVKPIKSRHMYDDSTFFSTEKIQSDSPKKDIPSLEQLEKSDPKIANIIDHVNQEDIPKENGQRALEFFRRLHADKSIDIFKISPDAKKLLAHYVRKYPNISTDRRVAEILSFFIT